MEIANIDIWSILIVLLSFYNLIFIVLILLFSLYTYNFFKGRPPKAKSTCTMCNESKHPLNYVLPTQNGKKEFCSVNCLAEFRKEYVKVITNNSYHN